MHNSLWSTAFSGAAGAGMYWWANHVFNDCWCGQYQYFKPLADLMGNADLSEHAYICISNGCDCGGINDDDQNGGCGGNSTNNCYPLDNVCEQSPNSNFITDGIITSNEYKLEVYALMNEEKIIGWVHNKDNYWYNLPHDAGPNKNTYCQSLDNNQPTNPSDIATLENETMTITGLPCDGVYKIEFFSAYPEYDVDNDGTNEDGGIIPSFTLNNIGVHCGNLNFTIPKLQALGSAPYAPDYGFKVSKEQNSWTNIVPSTSSSHKINGNISGDNNNIFYKGTDSRLHHYWYSNGQWNHEWLTNWSNSSQNVGNSISIPQVDGKVFYEGTDDRLHEYYFSNGQWNHTWHTDWASTSQNIGGEIVCSPDGTHVFYRGNDGYIHQQYYMGNGQWGHDWMVCYNYLSSSFKAKSHISSSNNKVFYEGSDSKVHIWEYGSECNPQPLFMISNNEDKGLNKIDLNKASISSAPIVELDIISYPNPFSNLLYIKGINPKQSIKVFDVMGRTYFESQSIKNSEFGINTASWPNGMYIVIVRGESKTDINTIKVNKND